MKKFKSCMTLTIVSLASLLLTACAYTSNEPLKFKSTGLQTYYSTPAVGTGDPADDYSSRLPQQISTHEKVIVVDPRQHVWGAYSSDGKLLRAGVATTGANWCPDRGKPCRTTPGTYQIYSLGSPSCKSHIFPIGKGGAPMPYCMFFHGNQALHGSYDSEVIEGNASHGCVRMHIEDAEWVRYNFANVGTKVVVKSY